MFQTVLLHLQMVSRAHLLSLALRLLVPIVNEEKTLPMVYFLSFNTLPKLSFGHPN